MAKLDPTKMADWQIAFEAEKNMKKVQQLAEALGIKDEELIPYGHYYGKVDYRAIMERVKDRPDGKYIDVTAITPTPLGEGKSTSTMGLVQGLGKRGKKVTGAIRQPSGGPTMNIKGSAAGGGLAQCIPLTPFSLGLTGDINDIINAHNLGMVALTSRMQHEYINDDAFLAAKNLKRLDIDHRNVEMKWVIDFCDKALRNITIGMGGRMEGFMMQSGFAIAVSSELMAILAVATASRTCAKESAGSSLPITRRAIRSPRPTWKWTAPCAPGWSTPSTRTCCRPSKDSRSLSTRVRSRTSPSANPPLWRISSP
jgi:formate--tetrahydrofolate ligase